ncbi:Pre-mRNA splicing protein, putative [Trichomonas vaginalis G3]|uniref:Pre-mRNA splicing protein, putative n=1 Tax=Trichomonas vaginalis (strain ATCC PRA-98 / G3) TaxID=412133 RepID=A2DMY5_TRIV3|nr:mRNA splicing, via spliceosome [Trichomonas vaginalis G3]EAY18162.1 Pre-mRNA splicing protein, putative [Trichomonas vaginalis G3]KAI5491459.1 mRNA splicing, via spliceosome [Trichomonas vaginalis G3]|eukprot:XP_001579148.1 Pre-mRNA splicing protein [Trichomonas vaginalis G3]
MDLANLISSNKQRTNELYGATRFVLPKSSLMEAMYSDLSFETQTTTNKFLPKSQKEINIEKIAPAPVIDERPDRARQNLVEDGIAAKPHRNWYNYCVLTGHAAWVKAISVDQSNEFFVTGSTDRMIKFWRLAERELTNTLTGHTGAVLDLCLSKQGFPYLYSVGDAKEVYNWDLNMNSIIRRFFGHGSGVYCVDEHPSLPIIATGSRDSTVRVWDLRTQSSVFTLEGHERTVFDVMFLQDESHLVTASADSRIRIWDLKTGKMSAVLTNHKKTIRKLSAHPRLFSFVSASADAIFQWNGQDAKLYREFKSHEAVITGLAINEDGVMVTSGDDGSLKFWDFDSGTCFQETSTVVQPGSLAAEKGILDISFDKTGTRLITCEMDKTVKLWREVDENGKPY